MLVIPTYELTRFLTRFPFSTSFPFLEVHKLQSFIHEPARRSEAKDLAALLNYHLKASKKISFFDTQSKYQAKTFPGSASMRIHTNRTEITNAAIPTRAFAPRLAKSRNVMPKS